jgi:transcriptional regulator with XRE-family HTH domain
MARSSGSHAGRVTKGSRASDAGFGSRLGAVIRERGWTMGETAKRVREQLGEGAKFTPANISHYTRGRSIPRLRYLDALSAVLGIDKRELMGQDNSPIRINGDGKDAAVRVQEVRLVSQSDAAAPALHIEDRGKEAWLQINQQVSWPVALKILEALKGKDE